MAIVVPFADPQAHGSIADSVTFRRFRNKVVFQKKPRVRWRGTPGQIAQTTKFKAGWKTYRQLPAWTIDYLKTKASQLGRSTTNYYLSLYLTDEIPSDLPMNTMQQIIDCNLPEPAAAGPQIIQLEFFTRVDAGPDYYSMGTIYDNENIFTPGGVMPTHDRSLLRITFLTPGSFDIPFEYPMVIKWKTFSDVEVISLIRLPAIHFGPVVTPSTTPLTNMRDCTDMNIPVTAMPPASQIILWMGVWRDPPAIDYDYGYIYDPQNHYFYSASPLDETNQARIRVTWAGSQPPLPDDYELWAKMQFLDLSFAENTFYFPAISVHTDLWIADDYSLYYDMAMTNLAKAAKILQLDLWIASDFSLYWDQALTQLAATPFF